MKRMLSWCGTLLVMAGVGLFVWLLNGNAESEARQEELIDAFQSVQSFGSEAAPPLPKAKDDEIPEVEGLEGMEGILSIPAIDLKAPVLAGADAKTLSESLGSIANMDMPGKIDGSYAIAGHQAHVFGQYFNRLHEVEVGNEFTFQTMDEAMVFEVFDIQIVRPHEVVVLAPRDGIALMSLITCYPQNSNEFRLVVQAKRVE